MATSEELVISHLSFVISKIFHSYQLPITNYQLPITNYLTNNI
jgi:hypothetical protein